MIIGATDLLAEFNELRIMYIGGGLGKGKTILALQFAEKYLKRGLKLYTNVATVWGDEWQGLDEDKGLNAVVLLDEGGFYIRSMDSVSALSGFARKINTYIIISGKRAPHEELTELWVEQRFDFYKNFGLPFRLWSWRNYGARRPYGSHFLEIWRKGLYGTYSTLDPGENAGFILKYLQQRADDLFKAYDRTYSLQDVARGGGDNAALDTAAEAAANVRRIRDAISLLEGKKRGGGTR